MSHKVLFVLLDAFRWDYINPVDTPYLHAICQRGVYARKLKSSPGFTQRTAIYTGTLGDESGMFTMYTFDAEGSPFHFLRGDARLQTFSRVDQWWRNFPVFKGSWRIQSLFADSFRLRQNQFRDWIREEVRKYADNAPLSHIPLFLLPEIGVSEDNKPIYEPGAFAQESIFDVFANHQIYYDYLMYPVVNCEDEAVLSAFLSHNDRGSKIILGQFSDSDLLVHHCGPSSPKRREVTGEIDRKLREIASCYGDDTTWIIIGDHGMSDVVEEIDIPALLTPLEKRYNAVMGRDYLLFLDSTMARFKWLTRIGESFVAEVERMLPLLEKGRFLNLEISRRFGVPFGTRLYGDLIWLANNGVLLFPDYFHDHSTHNKGMHGYITDHDDTKGFFLAHGPGIGVRQLDEANLIDVCPTICAAVGVPAPQQNRGKSLLDK